MTITEHPPTSPAALVRMLWLDLTRQCQLARTHCYNESGPDGGHGSMTRYDWLTVVDQAAATGVKLVQLIGGEPTLHPDALDIADRALNTGMHIEIYSNLVHVSDAWWSLLQRPGAFLATSYYSSDSDQHNAMTGRPASHRHTHRNISRAVELGVALRASIITTDGTDVEETRDELQQLGAQRVGVDYVRLFGRGAAGQTPDTAGSCGGCGDGRAAINPNGTVTPCIMSAWMGVGNVQETPLVDILTGNPLARARDKITAGKQDDPPPAPKPCGPDRWCSPGTPTAVASLEGKTNDDSRT